MPLARTVVLISIDTLRADHVGCYGYPRPTSPHLDAFAREAVVFEDVTSPAPWTLPAHGSMLTGLYPVRHGLKASDTRLPDSIPTLAEILSRKGFATAGVVNSYNLGPHYGLDRGFKKFLYVAENAGNREPGTKITNRALRWLKRLAGEPLFLFVHYYDVHSNYASRREFERMFVGPYDGPADGTTAQLTEFRTGKVRLGPADAAHLVDLYDAGIRQLDEELARLLHGIKSLTRDQAFVMITADHGEEFLERGNVLHGRTQFQEMAHVPLIVRGPGLPAGRRLKTPVSLIDVFPTLLHLGGVEPPTGIDGENLASLWSSEPPPHLDRRALFGEADNVNVENDITRAVRLGPHKLHFNRLTKARQLFDLERDPRERLDLSKDRFEVMRDLGARLARFLEIQGPVLNLAPLPPEEAERLKSLGYLQ